MATGICARPARRDVVRNGHGASIGHAPAPSRFRPPAVAGERGGRAAPGHRGGSVWIQLAPSRSAAALSQHATARSEASPRTGRDWRAAPCPERLAVAMARRGGTPSGERGEFSVLLLISALRRTSPARCAARRWPRPPAAARRSPFVAACISAAFPSRSVAARLRVRRSAHPPWRHPGTRRQRRRVATPCWSGTSTCAPRWMSSVTVMAAGTGLGSLVEGVATVLITRQDHR